jgi:hypothetical protein
MGLTAEQLESLKEFARARIREAWEGCENGDVVQDAAEKLGLIVPKPGGFDPDQDGEDDEYGAEPGDPWYVFADWLATPSALIEEKEG